MSVKTNVLLLCDSFPPDLTVGARRWERFVRRLSDEYYFVVIANGEVTDGVEEQGESCVVRRVAASSITLSRFVNTYGVERTESSGKVASPLGFVGGFKRYLRNSAPALRQVRALIPGLDVGCKYCRVLVKDALDVAKEVEFDLIIASHPMSGNLLAAKELSGILGVPWIADFRDPWTDDYHNPLPLDSFLGRLQVKRERYVLSSAARVLVVNEEMKEFVHAEDSLFEVIPNCSSFDKEDGSDGSDGSDGVVRLGLAGTVAEFSEFSTFVHMLVELERRQSNRGEVKFEIHHFGPEGADEFLRNEIAKVNLSSLSYLKRGNLDLSALKAELALLDASLLFGYSGRAGSCIMSGKVFDYVSAGRPILFVTEGSGGVLRRIVDLGNVGMVVESSEELSQACEQLSRVRLGQLENTFSPNRWFKDSYGLGSVSESLRRVLKEVKGVR